MLKTNNQTWKKAGNFWPCCPEGANSRFCCPIFLAQKGQTFSHFAKKAF
jgi:Zn-finger protein